MKAREVDATSSYWKDDIQKLKPFIDDSISDSGQLDNAIELLVRSGRTLAHSAHTCLCVALRVHVAADRYLDKTARSREMGSKYIDYMCRFDNKYAELNGTYDRYDGNPFT